MSINLKEDQKRDYDDVNKELKSSNRGALIRPTGTGKSFIALKFIEDNEEKKVLYLAPSTSILHQIKENALKQDAKFIQRLKRMTYQKLTKLDIEEMKQLNPDIIILDEFHHCGSPIWGKAVKDLCELFPNAKILGLSATPIRYFDGNIDMAEEMFGEHVVSNISFEEAIENGVLPQFDYVSAMYGYEDKLINLKEQIENSNASKSKKEEARKLFEELSKQLGKDTINLPEILGKHMTNKNGKYMVFCSNIEEMQKKIKEAQELFSKINPNIKIYNVSSDGSFRNNQNVLKQFEKDNDENSLKLMFSVNMLNEGYHLPDVDGVVMMRPTKSPTVYMQQLGRALTIGNTEKRPVIIDLVDNFDSIRVIENTVGKLREIEGKKTSTSPDKKRFNIIDYTIHIREISDRIEKLSRLQSLTLTEKIDLFEKYYEENREETIHGDTIYNGYPIGQYMISIRQAIIHGKNNMKYDENDIERLEKLGLLYDANDTIEAKVERLKLYCKDHPYAFSNYMEIKKQLQIEGKEKELEEFEKLYNSNYKYITARRNRGKITDEIENELKEAKIGGVFGFAEEDIILGNKYGINPKVIMYILQDFGTIDNFRKAYIEFRVEQASESDRDENIDENIKRNSKIMKYIKDLPLVDAYELESSPGYKKLLKAILGSYDGVVIGKGYKEDVDRALETLREKEKIILKARFGLNGEKTKTLDELAVDLNSTREGMRQREAKALRKLRNPVRKVMDNIYGKPNEEFVRSYFEMHDIFIDNSEPNLNDEEIEKLTAICQKQKQEMIEKEQKIKREKIEEIREKGNITVQKDLNVYWLEELGLSVRTYNCFKRIGVHSVGDLLERIKEKEDLQKVKNLGKVSMNEIIDAIHSLGIKFSYEVEQDNIEEDAKTEDRPKIKKGDFLLKELGLSPRTNNCFTRAGINSVGDLLERFKKEEDFYNVRNLQKGSLDEIIKAVHDLGFKFSYEVNEANIEESKEEMQIEDRKEETKKEVQIEDKKEEPKEEEQIEERKEETEEAYAEAETQESQEANPKSKYQELVLKIMGCDTEYTKIKKELKEINSKKKSIKTKIEELKNKIAETSNNDVTKTVAEALMEAFELLQEQKDLLRETDAKLKEVKEVENANRRMKKQYAQKIEEIIRGEE